MAYLEVCCSCCDRKFLRGIRQVNEAKKFGWKQYCSSGCLGRSRSASILLVCNNPSCKNTFQRTRANISVYSYCSRSCSAIVNNSKYPKNPGVRKICNYCREVFVSRKRFCSAECQHMASIIGKDKLIVNIREFYTSHGRIPTKVEFSYYSAIRYSFGSFNNAIKEAGFIPNPVMFSSKWVSEDGHKCDSFAEKIIDDWLFSMKISHEKGVRYPGSRFASDFKIREYWVEYFGLSGQIEKYDAVKRWKIKLAKSLGLKLIKIYPKDLFPNNRLESIFSRVIN